MILRPAVARDTEPLLDLWDGLQQDGAAADPRYRPAPDGRALIRAAVRDEWTRLRPFPNAWVAEDDGVADVRVVREPPAARPVGFRPPGEPAPAPLPEAGPLVAFLGGAPASVSRVFDRPPTARIETLYVAPSHRRRGLGRRLVELFVETAHAAGYPEIEVGTLVRDERAVAFWRAAGFDPMRVVLVR